MRSLLLAPLSALLLLAPPAAAQEPPAGYGLVWAGEFYRFANDGAGDKTTWPFDRPFELILNIAVGGDWGGPKASTTQPCRR